MKLSTRRFLLAFILLTELILLIYFGFLKKGMHFDECFSYFNTNNSVGRMAYDRDYVSSFDIMKDFYVLEGEGFNYGYVVKLQSYDVHPPLFYLLLHTLCSFMPGVFSIWQGLALNILYTLISTIIVYLIIKELFENEIFALGATLIFAINTGVICNMLFIRMYCLMTMFILLAIYMHIKMSEYVHLNDIKTRYIILNAVLAYLGFMTHYFYLLFIFLLEFFFWLPKILNIKCHFKGFIKYCLGMIIAGGLGIALYPSCLGHVHSGYRGQEVMGYLKDTSDFGERLSFFTGLMNRFVFNGFLYIFLLASLLLFLFAYYKAAKIRPELKKVYVFVECIFFPTLGYFLVSAKSSLIGDEAMMRYQLPIYGLSLIALLVIIVGCVQFIIKEKDQKIKQTLMLIIMAIFLCTNIIGLVNKNVFYLYTEQENMNDIASNHKDETCVYIYHNENQKYLLWNDALELAKYKEVYFIDSSNKEPITDTKITDADKLVVYVSTLGIPEDINSINKIVFDTNHKVSEFTKLYDAVYATCYEFY